MQTTIGRELLRPRSPRSAATTACRSPGPRCSPASAARAAIASCSTQPPSSARRALPVIPQVSCRPLQLRVHLRRAVHLREHDDLIEPVSARRRRARDAALYADPASGAAVRAADSCTAGCSAAGWDRTVDRVVRRRTRARGAAASPRSRRERGHATRRPRARPRARRRPRRALPHGRDELRRERSRPSCSPIRNTMIALSDAGAHASQLCDACYSTYLLAHWVRERKAFTLEEAVRKLTSRAGRDLRHHRPGRAGGRPAGRRRRVRPGDRRLPRPAARARPAGRRRPPGGRRHGIDAVIVNGTRHPPRRRATPSPPTARCPAACCATAARGRRAELADLVMIPVIDLGPYLAVRPARLRTPPPPSSGRALQDVGFFVIVNHGIAPSPDRRRRSPRRGAFTPSRWTPSSPCA